MKLIIFLFLFIFNVNSYGTPDSAIISELIELYSKKPIETLESLIVEYNSQIQVKSSHLTIESDEFITEALKRRWKEELETAKYFLNRILRPALQKAKTIPGPPIVKTAVLLTLTVSSIAAMQPLESQASEKLIPVLLNQNTNPNSFHNYSNVNTNHTSSLQNSKK